MSAVESQAAISASAVRQALQNMVATSTPFRPSPLCDLLLVEAYLDQQHFPHTFQSRHYALEKILQEFILQRFHHVCEMLQLAAPLLDEPCSQALGTIQAYARHDYPELTGWCWMYYRYIRPELSISAITFSQISHINGRTLRRYADYTIRALTNLLIEAEWRETQRRSV